MEIWTRFLSFESAVGDLTSLVKIEKRRAKALEFKTEFSDTTLLVDRYRYLDLFPVSTTELKVMRSTERISRNHFFLWEWITHALIHLLSQALGWQDFGSQAGPSVATTTTTSGALPGIAEETVAAPTGAAITIAKPDLSQMVRRIVGSKCRSQQ